MAPGCVPRSLPRVRHGTRITPILSFVFCAMICSVAIGGELLVNSEPLAASVTLDGVPQDKAPVSITNVVVGPHLLTLHKDNFQEYRRTIMVSNRKTTEDVKLQPITGLVIVHSTPPGAEVQVNGGHRGQTPLLLTDLPIGTKYRLKVTSPGYQSKTVDLALETRAPRKIDVNLLSDSGRLTVDSIPQGATVTIDGATHGNTPCTLDRIPYGKKTVVISLSGYQPFRQEIVVESGSSNDIVANLTAIPGMLSVISTPSLSKVFINDQFKGETVLNVTNLPGGNYTVRVEHKGYETMTKTCEVQRGGTATLEFTLVRNSGILELITEPAGAQVFVDGEDCGTTKAGESDLSSNPLRVDLLSKGTHRLQLTKKGYFATEKTFDVEMDKTVTLNEKLKKRFIADTQIRFIGDTGVEEVKIGAISQRFPNGDIELETKPGIFSKVAADKMISVDRINTPKE